MKVKLTVVQGKPEGKEFVLPKNPFLIGRGEKCHLRPNNDAVGEQHCAVIAKADDVLVRDLGSQTGTQINGQKVDGEVSVKTGDLLQVGPLVFAITLIETRQKPVPAQAESTAPEPAQASASSSTPPQEEDEDIDVTDWLGGGEPSPAPPPVQEEQAPAAIREPVFDDMDLPQDPSSASAASDDAEATETEEGSEKKPAGSDTASTSRAASDLLRKYFTRPRE